VIYNHILNKTTLGRVLAIDYGRKRVGLAISDPTKLIANGLTTISNHELWDYLKDNDYTKELECIVVGYPKKMNNEPSQIVEQINPFVKKLKKLFPEIEISLMDERFTSKIATKAIFLAGAKKKDRKNKALIDKVSATIILQSYLDCINR